MSAPYGSLSEAFYGFMKWAYHREEELFDFIGQGEFHANLQKSHVEDKVAIAVSKHSRHVELKILDTARDTDYTYWKELVIGRPISLYLDKSIRKMWKAEGPRKFSIRVLEEMISNDMINAAIGNESDIVGGMIHILVTYNK